MLRWANERFLPALKISHPTGAPSFRVHRQANTICISTRHLTLPIGFYNAMKAKNDRKGFSSTEELPNPAESGTRVDVNAEQMGVQPDGGEVLYELNGDQPLKNDDFVVLTDNIKCCILRMSDLLRLEAEGNYSRVYDWLLDAYPPAASGFEKGRHQVFRAVRTASSISSVNTPGSTDALRPRSYGKGDPFAPAKPCPSQVAALSRLEAEFGLSLPHWSRSNSLRRRIAKMLRK